MWLKLEGAEMIRDRLSVLIKSKTAIYDIEHNYRENYFIQEK
jgi:hypothetical protein